MVNMNDFYASDIEMASAGADKRQCFRAPLKCVFVCRPLTKFRFYFSNATVAAQTGSEKTHKTHKTEIFDVFVSRESYAFGKQ